MLNLDLSLTPLVPPAWAKGGHAQTLLGYFIPSPTPSGQGEKVDLALPDGDHLIGRHLPGDSDTVIYLFHGLGGDTSANYIRRTTQLCQAQGHTVFSMNHRGCGEGRGLARSPYHSGRAEDLAEFIRHGRKLYPRKKHIGIGFSLSGNALLLLASGKRGEVQPDAAIAVNAPIRLNETALSLQQGLNRMYDFWFVQLSKRDLNLRKRSGLLDGDYAVPMTSTLRDFDAIYTAKAGGFRDRDDYYASCSTHRLLEEIQLPTLILTAEDDPVIPFRFYREAKLSPWVHLHVEKTGGHLGYLTARKTPLGTNRWLDYALLESIGSIRRAT